MSSSVHVKIEHHDNSNLRFLNKKYLLTSNVESPEGGKSFNIARQRGPLGSELSPGPRQTAPNHEIHHDIMHARPLVTRNSLSYKFSR